MGAAAVGGGDERHEAHPPRGDQEPLWRLRHLIHGLTVGSAASPSSAKPVVGGAVKILAVTRTSGDASTRRKFVGETGELIESVGSTGLTR